MISAAEATAFLDYFCDGAAQTDHAVLIDAPWGAGKTHFIKDYLKARDLAARKTDELVGAPFLYASLYGVSTLDEVREQFFTQAYPVLSSAPVRLIGTALAGVVKKWTGAEIAKDDLKLSHLRLDAHVLVFDDLERAAMPLVDALGLINAFVEHGDYKVIVITNQAEVPADQRTDYERQREKVIGRTLAISTDPALVLTKLIGEMHYDNARRAAQANMELIVRIFAASETQNLRSLRAAIGDFDRLVGTLDEKLAECPEALQRLLAYIVAVEVELRTGLTPRELEALMSVRLSFSALKASEAPEAQKARALQAKYPEVEWRDSIVPPGILAEYLTTGVLDIQAANQAISIHPLIAEPRAVPAWRRLIAWQLRGAEAFETDRAAVLEEFNKREIIEPGEICHITGIALWLEQMDAPLLSNVYDDMRAYINDVEAAGTLIPGRSIFTGAFSEGWAGYTFCCVEHTTFALVKAHLGAAISRVFDEKVKAAVPNLLDQLRCTANEGEALYDGQHAQGHYGGIAILHHVPVTDFADLLLSDGRANRELAAALGRRYEYWGRDGGLLVERPWLEALKEELDNRSEAYGPPFALALRNTWSATFDGIFGMFRLLEQRVPAARAGDQS